MSDLPVYIYNREFKAPRAKVWRAWRDPALLATWYGPGVETIIHAFHMRAGGVWKNEMKMRGMSDYSRMDFLEVIPEEKIVWNHNSTDENWEIAANKMMPDWPKTLLTTVTFREQGETTKVQLQQTPVDASEVEIACFTKMMSNMDHGWGAGFDLIENLLKDEA